MPLVKVIRIGSRRTEIALERIVAVLEEIRDRLEPTGFEREHEPLVVDSVSEVIDPEERDESVGIEE